VPMGSAAKSVFAVLESDSDERISFLGIEEKALFETAGLRGIA